MYINVVKVQKVQSKKDNNPRVAPKSMQRRFNENWATEIANLIEAWCYAGERLR